ncbi:MAG TPA: hypothetical protein VF950_14885 [Planctomycetota bacterium]
MKSAHRGLLAGIVLILALAAVYRWMSRPDRAPAPPRTADAPPGPAPNPAVPRPADPPPRSPSEARPQAAPPRELLRRAGRIVDAYFKRTPVPDVPSPQDYATNLPVGWFQLLVRAFPEEAFEIYSAEYLGDPQKATVAYWALGELARQRHESTFRLFNAQLEGGDSVRARQALKVLANYETPQLGPRVLALVPSDPGTSDEAELLRTALRTAASSGSADPAALRALLDRFDRRAVEAGIPDYYGTAESRLRAEVMGAPDRSAALAAAVAKDTDDLTDDLERAGWAADVAVRSGRRDLVPALRERIKKEVERLRADGREEELDVLGRHSKGRFDVPSAGALGGLEGVRAIAKLRRAVLDLGGELSDEERRWLDGLRMLRTPREYLVEAGLAAP